MTFAAQLRDIRKDYVLKSETVRALRGVTLVCEVDGLGDHPGRVCEFGRDGSLRRSFDANVRSPGDVQLLRNGRVLIAEHWPKRVTERDWTGKIVWEKQLDDGPVSAERLANGNTFIATSSVLMEVRPDGKEVSKHTRSNEGRIYCAQKLRNGNILYVTSTGQIVELDPTGKQLRTVAAGDTSNWGSVEALPNGHFLVCRCGLHQVVEIDATGKEVWKCAQEWPTWASRRANGRTLVASAHAGVVVEFDREGKAVWQHKLSGRPCRVKLY